MIDVDKVLLRAIGPDNLKQSEMIVNIPPYRTILKDRADRIVLRRGGKSPERWAGHGSGTEDIDCRAA